MQAMGSVRGSHGKLCFNHSHSLSDSFSKFLSPSLPPQRRHLLCIPKIGTSTDNGRGRSVTLKASREEETNESFAPLAPVELESPVGQLLEQILRTQPHLITVAVDEQLEKIASESASLKANLSSTPDVLSKRISGVRDMEKRKVLAEIIYCLVVQKFVEKGISMIPQIKPTSDPAGRVDLWPNQEEKLKVIHSAETFEMIQSLLSSVLGDRTAVGPLSSIVRIRKSRLENLYDASVLYGYFLRRLDQTYQLERSMNTLPKQAVKTRERLEECDPDYTTERGQDVPSSRFRSYVMQLDSDTLQRYSTIRSKEAMSLTEKQTQALFGRPNREDEIFTLSASGLAMLVLEAVSFGSFLWDAESYVESKYHFLKA